MYLFILYEGLFFEGIALLILRIGSINRQAAFIAYQYSLLATPDAAAQPVAQCDVIVTCDRRTSALGSR